MMPPRIDHTGAMGSALHRWHPAPKLLGMGFYVFGVALLGRVEVAACALAVSCAMVAASGVPFGAFVGRMKWVILFLVPVAALVPLDFRGFGHGLAGLVWERESIGLAVLIALRALAIVAAFFVLTTTTPVHRVTKALRDLGLPSIFVQMALFTYRYLFVFEAQLVRMRAAMASRGFRPRFNRATLRAAGYLVGMLLVGSHERTERVLNSMKSRGYTGAIRSLDHPEPRGADWMKLGVLAAVTLAMTLGERLWPS